MVTSRDKMIEDNIGLVHSIANRFKGRGVEYDDLFQSGCVGLIKAQALREKFINTELREPTVSELSDMLDCPPEEIPEILGVIAPMVSLSSASEDGEYTIDVPVDESEELFNRLVVHRLFKFLDDTERAIVDMRYYKGFTQAKTAKVLGISQVQVSRKEKSLLKKLRKYLQ